MTNKGFAPMDGELFYTIEHAERLPEFFMSLISPADHWMFISSKGALTAGRKNPEGALFPYETVDKIMAQRGINGSRTILRVRTASGLRYWEPYADWSRAVWKVSRQVSKNMPGSRVVFSETNHDLGLVFSWAWFFSDRFGFVRKAWVENTGSAAQSVEVLDGFVNLMNSGITRALQTTMSCLTDAYKDNMLMDSGLGLFGLASVITDRAEPREGLRATAAWQLGMDGAAITLDGDAFESFLLDEAIVPQTRVRGKKSAYLVNGQRTLAPGAQWVWYLVGDVGLDHGAVGRLDAFVRQGSAKGMVEIEGEYKALNDALMAYLAQADGLSVSRLSMHQWHHGANVMFNIMRGGLPATGLNLRADDIVAFVKVRRPALVGDFRALLGSDATLEVQDFHRRCAATGKADVVRLGRDYLPLTFSRRHGDPSRPWNEFSIRVKDAAGLPILDYQGNWRDIFQNWEALAQSFPPFLPSFVGIFLDATTIDGYNPYRVMRSGIDWEKVEPENPWSNIGYWNDHQIIYLQKLLESMEDHYPGALAHQLDQRVYAWANIPYRINSYGQICANPRSTIRFDHLLDEKITQRVETMGTDARLILDSKGEVVHGTLMEKVLTLFLAKVGNLVPDGGIWLNTQRPEWNDANNALAGYGLSMVTVMYVRRFAAWWKAYLEKVDGQAMEVMAPLARLVDRSITVLQQWKDGRASGAPWSDHDRKTFMDAMGQALDDYRQVTYQGQGLETRQKVGLDRIRLLFDLSLDILEGTIRHNRREDGLYHAYNVLQWSGDGKGARVRTLYPMLEGQVAALSAGLLDARETLELYRVLRQGPLYREDQRSYLLYPDRPLPDFMHKNTVDDAYAAKLPALAGKIPASGVATGDLAGLMYRDSQGILRFNAGMENFDEVKAAIGDRIKDPKVLEDLENLYEHTFGHREFTGRSGAMYAYEGLGSIYWHMVAKLMLAYMDAWQDAQAAGQDASLVQGLLDAYVDIRRGIGYQKSATEWGAFPWDPYSHTPKHAKAQQPGMTGQVKEEVLTRFAEAGMRIRNGLIRFLPAPILADEYLEEAASFPWQDVHGVWHTMAVKPGELIMTLCQVPCVFVKGGASSAVSPRVEVHTRDGAVEEFLDGIIPASWSAEIFSRTGKVSLVRVIAR